MKLPIRCVVQNQCEIQTLCIHKSVPLRGPEAARAEEVPDGARGRQLRVTGIKHHAEIFGDHCWLSAVLHLVQIYRTMTN